MRQLAIFAFLTLLSITSRAQSEQVQLKPFETLYVYGPFHVRLVASVKERMEIDYRDVDKEDVLIDSDDGELELKLRTKHYWHDWNESASHNNNRYVKVTLYCRSLKEISVKAGASVVSDFTVTSPSLSLVSSMGAELKLDVKTDELELDSSMGSDVVLTGTTATLEVYSKMGSTVNAFNLKSEKAVVRAYMGSDISVFASKELDASAGFGAVVHFGGDPSVRNTSHSFGGETTATRH